MEYSYTGKMICKRCRQVFDWYCINLSLLPRSSEPQVFMVPNGSHMVINSFDLDGTPVFKGGCSHCGFTNQLPDELVKKIPKEIYSRN